MVMGVCLAMIGLGYFVASLLASIVKHVSRSEWYPDNLNRGTLEYYMFLLSGLMLVNLTVFLFLAVRYRYVVCDQDNPEDDERVERKKSSSSFSNISQNDLDNR